MKIYIVGSIASGKSTFAKELSQIVNIPFRSLDELVHIPDKSYPSGNRKRSIEERELLFQSIMQQADWIVEDVGRPCFEEGLTQADTIVLLEVPTIIRNYRIIKRWVKQRLGMEKCIYNPRYKMLRSMLKWSKDYDTGKDKLKERMLTFQNKTVTIRNRKEINRFCILVKPCN